MLSTFDALSLIDTIDVLFLISIMVIKEGDGIDLNWSVSYIHDSITSIDTKIIDTCSGQIFNDTS